MSLRSKILFLFFIVFVGLVLTQYFTVVNVLFPRYEDLDRRAARENLLRLKEGVQSVLDSMETQAYSWAAWDDAYRFVKNPTKDFVQSNLQIEGLLAERFHTMAFVDLRGQIVQLTRLDLTEGVERKASPEMSQFITRPEIYRHADEKSVHKGIAVLPEGPLLFVSLPIVTSKRRGPIAGTLFRARFLDSDLIKQMADVGRFPFSVYPWDLKTLENGFPWLSELLATPDELSKPVVYNLSRKTMQSYLLLNDYRGNPGILLAASMPREFFAEGRSTANLLAALFSVLVLIFSLITFIFLDRMIFSRLTGLGEAVRDISFESDERFENLPEQPDEIGQLAGIFNRAFESLRQSHQRYRQVVDLSHDWIWSIDLEGRWTFVNPAVKTIAGYEPHEMIGRKFTEFLTPDIAEQDFKVFKEIISGKNVFHYLSKIIHKKGNIVDLSISATFVRDPKTGLVVGATGTATNITTERRVEAERQRAFETIQSLNDTLEKQVSKLAAANRALQESQEQLIQAQKMEAIGKLAGGVAHDFNNLLGSILGYVNLLQERCRDDEKTRKSLKAIEKAVLRGADLTKQLLSFARGSKITKRPLMPATLLREARDLASRTFDRKITISYSEPDMPWFIEGDAGQLSQVFMNLLINARDAMPQGGKLQIQMTNMEVDEALMRKRPGLHLGPYVKISIEDNGEGISSENLPRIFEPFFTTKELGKGTGLGLSLVYAIVHDFGGVITVDSEVGRGTTFSLYFPAYPGHSFEGSKVATYPKKTSSNSERSRLQNVQILVVDDEPSLRELAKDFLEAEGAEVFTAEDGERASEILESHPDIFLALLDVVMPRRSGIQVFKELRKIRPGLKVVFISGFADQKEIETFLDLPGVSFVGKPYHPKELLDQIFKLSSILPPGSATT